MQKPFAIGNLHCIFACYCERSGQCRRQMTNRIGGISCCITKTIFMEVI